MPCRSWAVALFPSLLLLLPANAHAEEAGADTSLPGAGDGRFHARMLAWESDRPPPPAAPVINVGGMEPLRIWKISSGFGMRRDPLRGDAAMHSGIDIPDPYGTPVRAAAAGQVRRARVAGGYGNLVEIDHGGGQVTRYGHLSRLLVREGMRVQGGDLIGLVGATGRSTGSHLHYEVRMDGRAVDPLPFLRAGPSGGSVTDRGPMRLTDDRPTLSAFARARDADQPSGVMQGDAASR